MQSLFLFTFQLLSVAIWCTRHGDEQFGDNTPGVFYVFADKVIHVLDPESLKILKNITVDHLGAPLENAGGDTIKWYEGVYMEDDKLGVRYVFISEGDTYEKHDGQDSFTHSYVTVIDADKHEIVARVEVGPRPVHSFGIFELNEYWTHSDTEGALDVIKLGNYSTMHAYRVESLVEEADHGGLLVDPDLFPLVYVTSAYKQYLQEINIETKEIVGRLSYAESLEDATQCTGTHAIAYSSVNMHIYIGCVAGGGILEWDTVTDTLVHQWVNDTGALYETPDGNFIIAADKHHSKVSIFEPRANGLMSNKAFEANVPGNPSSPLFYPKSQTPRGLNDYLAFFPQTRNTNINNLLAAEALNSDVTDPGYYSKPVDCVYNMSSGFPLKLAVDENGEKVSPNCGSCAEGVATRDASMFDASISGIGWIDLQDVIGSEESVTAEFIEAGAVFQGSPSSTSNECAYGHTYRSAKRGGNYVAVVADLPQPSVYVVDAAADPPALWGMVPTASGPIRIIYVPSAFES